MRAAVVLTSLLILALLPAFAQSQGPVTVIISAPDVAGTLKTVSVNVTVAGGPAEANGTFLLKAWLSGPDLTGAAPLQDNPLEMSSQNKSFTFNATMPSNEQAVDLIVEINSTKGAEFEIGSSSKRIQVLVPLTVSANIKNTGAVEVRDVPVFFYLDNKFIQETTLDSLKPGESKAVTFEYLPVGLGEGAHTLEIRVDFDRNGIIEAALGEVAHKGTFYRIGEPISPIFIVVGVAVGLVAALFILAALRRRRAGK